MDLPQQLTHAAIAALLNEILVATMMSQALVIGPPTVHCIIQQLSQTNDAYLNFIRLKKYPLLLKDSIFFYPWITECDTSLHIF